MPMTIAFDTKTNKAVLFVGGGAEVENLTGVVSPISADIPDIPNIYGAMVAAMAETLIRQTCKDILDKIIKEI